jgi:hypothetical protein
MDFIYFIYVLFQILEFYSALKRRYLGLKFSRSCGVICLVSGKTEQELDQILMLPKRGQNIVGRNFKNILTKHLLYSS